MIEKRKYVRVRCSLASRYKEPGAKESRIFSATVLIEDISMGGARLRTAKFIPLTKKLILHIQVPGRREVIVPVAPVWFFELPKMSAYAIGIQFTEMSKTDREEITRCVQKFLLQPKNGI